MRYNQKMPQRFTYENEQMVEEEVYEDEYEDVWDDDNSVSSYDELVDRDDDEVEPWPQPIIVRPPISSLVKMYAPPLKKPESLSSETVETFEAYKKKTSELNTLHSANCAAVKKIAAELSALEESGKGINKWSSRSMRDMQKKRLENDLIAAEKKKEESKAVCEKHKSSGEDLRNLMSFHQKITDIWEKQEASNRKIEHMLRDATMIQ